MAIELHLQKTTKTPWGFRLAGGAEYEVPLTVIKVTENSIAENAGMQEGDIIIKIKDIPTAELTHNEAHDILLDAGDDFTLTVKRGDLSYLPPRLLLYETSVENAEDMVDDETKRMQVQNGSGKENDGDLNITDEEIVNIIGEQVQISSQKAIDKSSIKMEEIETCKKEVKQEVTEEINIHKQSEVSKVVFSEESQKTEERKWSAFLQKPKNPKPKPKVKEPEGPKAPPYRVIIKKQPKKDQHTIKEASDIEEKELESKHIPIEQEEVSKSTENVTIENKIDASDIEDSKDTDDIRDEENYFHESENEREDENKVSESPRSEEKEEEIQPSTEEKQKSPTEKRLSIDLEQQLAQVRQQLEALAQLPSAIQQTLSAVTQQLTEIALAKHVQEQEVIAEAEVMVHEETTEEYLEMSEDYEEKALSTLEEESCEHYEEEIKEEIREESLECMRNESEEEQALFEELEKQIEEEERKKLEEMEARRIEQERIQKKDKERRSSLPRTPLQRPIILPGGRKWSNPDDASPKIRRPSMTDEKIANTINMFSEVNHWNNIWPWSDTEKPVYRINFLKYQPPPKTLDHLKNSAVYRLVHDIEPPPRGVIARDGKVLAEQDYYVEKREGEN